MHDDSDYEEKERIAMLMDGGLIGSAMSEMRATNVARSELRVRRVLDERRKGSERKSQEQ